MFPYLYVSGHQQSLWPLTPCQINNKSTKHNDNFYCYQIRQVIEINTKRNKNIVRRL